MTFSPGWCYQPRLTPTGTKGFFSPQRSGRSRGEPLVPGCGTTGTTFSPDLLVPVATTGTKGPYQPGL
jgi:hypothetical protein